VTTLHIELEEDMKASLDGLFGSLGLDTQTAVRMFFCAAIAKGGIPFDVRRPEPNDALFEAIDDARHGRNLYGPYKTVDEAVAAMEAD